MSSRSTDTLAGLIAQKHEVLSQLRQVAHQQIEIIDRGETAALLKLLAAKQQLIFQLQKVEGQLTPFRAEDPEARDWSTPADRARCAAQAAQCNQLLDEVMQLEKQSEEKMTTRRNHVASQLQQLHTAGQARGAYQQHQTRRPTGPASVSPSGLPAPLPSAGLNLVTDT